MTTQTPATAEIEKWLQIWVLFFNKLWLRIRVRKKSGEPAHRNRGHFWWLHSCVHDCHPLMRVIPHFTMCGLVVNASGSVLVVREFGRVLPRPCKLVVQPSYRAHSMRKSCREHTQNTKQNRVKWNQCYTLLRPLKGGNTRDWDPAINVYAWVLFAESRPRSRRSDVWLTDLINC